MTDEIDDLLEEIGGQWDQDDPDVLIFANEDRSCVADVDGDLRLLSFGLIQARTVGKDDIRVAVDRHGLPRVVPLSTQSHRFDKDDFEDVADLVGSWV